MNKEDIGTVLWDIDEQNRAALPSDFVIQRVLSYGTLSVIIDTIKKQGFDAMKKVFSEMKPSAISAKKYHYLKNYIFAQK